MRKWIPVTIIVICLALWLQGKRIEIGTSTSEAAEVSAAESKSYPQLILSKSSSLHSLALEKSSTKELNSPVRMSMEEAYCFLLKAGVSIPLDGELKMSFQISHAHPGPIPLLRAMIQSSHCPPGLFSKVLVDTSGKILEQIDCRSTTAENLAVTSGSQGQIFDSPEETNHVDLALSGDGMFVQSCGGEVQYSRDGRFLLTEQGTLANRDGCDILDKRGEPLEFNSSENFDRRGCLNSGRCVAVVQPERDSFRILNRHTYVATDDPAKILLRDPYMFSQSYEDLQDPESGVIGPDFDKLPIMQKPVSCAGAR